METILALMATKWGKRITLGVGVALLVFIAYRWAYDRGRGDGESSGRIAGQQEIRKQAEADKAQHEKEIAAAQVREQAYVALIAQFNQALAQSNAAIAGIQRLRAADQKQVDQVPDAGLFADVVKKLDVRGPQDSSAGFTYPELRKIDSVVTDYPHLSDTIKEQGSAIALLQQRSDSQDKRISDVLADLKNSNDYGNRMWQYYAAAYNLAQKKPNWFVRAITFGRYQGKHINLPTPSEVKAGKQ